MVVLQFWDQLIGRLLDVLLFKNAVSRSFQAAKLFSSVYQRTSLNGFERQLNEAFGLFQTLL